MTSCLTVYPQAVYICIFAEPKGEASNRDVLSFHVVMYVCLYMHDYIAIAIRVTMLPNIYM